MTNLLNPGNLLAAVQGRICSALTSTWNQLTGSLQCGITLTGFDLGFGGFGGLGGGSFCPNISFGGGGPSWGSAGLGGTASGGGGIVVNGASLAPTGYVVPPSSGIY
ncbi:MAG: hypothetical protein H7Z10_03385 [Gemmatimonadaceae bacterium]|nr:hypothetical protein [Acetobacteraceae bacterium]